MDIAIKAKWIEALRSGEYEQARNELLTSGEKPAYCCIGVGYVACIHPKIDFGDDTYAAAEQLGLDDDITDKLTRLNDMDEKSFSDIANYIEENL